MKGTRLECREFVLPIQASLAYDLGYRSSAAPARPKRIVSVGGKVEIDRNLQSAHLTGDLRGEGESVQHRGIDLDQQAHFAAFGLNALEELGVRPQAAAST